MSSEHLKLTNALELDPDVFLSPVFPISDRHHHLLAYSTPTVTFLFLIPRISGKLWLYFQNMSKSQPCFIIIILSKLSPGQPSKSLTTRLLLVLLEPNLHTGNKVVF